MPRLLALLALITGPPLLYVDDQTVTWVLNLGSQTRPAKQPAVPRQVGGLAPRGVEALSWLHTS